MINKRNIKHLEKVAAKILSKHYERNCYCVVESVQVECELDYITSIVYRGGYAVKENSFRQARLTATLPTGFNYTHMGAVCANEIIKEIDSNDD